MKTYSKMRMYAAIVAVLFSGLAARAQVILADSYNVTGTGTGFGLNTGVNSGINPPTTRLTGTAAANLRYISTGTKTNTAYSITSNKLRVAATAVTPGRFTFSNNGTTVYDFSSVLGSATATPQAPVVYDLSIAIENDTPDVQRCSFALGTIEGDATTWDFGIQLFRTADTDNFYTIGKRIDTGSSGLAADINTFITNTVPGTVGSEISFLIRVTDAGSETNTFNSRVQVSLDGGFTWIYDTDSDTDLPSGWRLNGPGRYIMCDVAPDAGPVTYDNFSITPVPVSVALVSPTNGASGFVASASLKALVTNNIPGPLTVTYYTREVGKPYPGRDFAITVLPDTQNYAREAAGSGDAVKEMWFAQTEWIITNRVSKNIAYVAHLGDCVQNGDILNGGPNSTEWRNATNAMYRLENRTRTLRDSGIPYGIAVGNHDQEPNGDPDGATALYNQYFGSTHFDNTDYYGGHYSTNNDNHFDLFSVSGLDFIVLYFEFGRFGTGVMDWANDVLATNKNRRVIAVTHYIGSDSTPSNLSNQGDAILAGLGANTNFFMMLGGHVFNNGGEGSRSDTVSGHTVRTFVSDYQGRTNGGDGLMRIMYFSPSNNTVSIKTYSPWLDEYETDANSQLSFTYNMQLPTGAGTPGTAYVAVGTNLNVTPGTQSTFLCTGLQANKTYEWYAKVTDQAGNTVMSPSRKFFTTNNAAPVANNQSLTVVGDQPTVLTLSASDPNGDPVTFKTNSVPSHGLNSNFDAANGKITYSPTRGYRGIDRFTFQATDSVLNSGTANFDLTVTAPPDANTNGLPDAWETTYGITDPNGDADGDGQNNLAEYLANTNPTNAASVLRFGSATWQTNGNLGLTWSSVGGTRYRIQYSSGTNGSLSNSFLDIIRPLSLEMDPAPYGTNSTQSFSDVGTNDGRYYRVKVIP